MQLIALIIGAILITVAYRNSQGALAAALEKDVPQFVVWGGAIVAVGAIGVIPGLKPVSRLLLILVITVLVVNNYKKLIAGFQNTVKAVPTEKSNAAPVTAGNTKAVAPSGLASWLNPLDPSNDAYLNSPIDSLASNVPGG